MKWSLLVLGVVVVLAGVVALVGAALPVRHHATRKARFRVSPQVLYVVIAGPPDWRPGVKRFAVLPEKDGRRQWWEEDSHGQKIAYEVLEDTAPTRLVVRPTLQPRRLPALQRREHHERHEQETTIASGIPQWAD